VQPCEGVNGDVMSKCNLKAVFGHLPGPNRAWLLAVYIITHMPLTFLIWNNIWDVIHQTPTSLTAVAFGIPVTWLPCLHTKAASTSHALLGHRKEPLTVPPRWQCNAISTNITYSIDNNTEIHLLVGWSLTALLTQLRSYRAFKVKTTL